MAKLSDYHKKRHFEKTPEPRGAVEGGGKRVFCVQKHAATRLHYDLRLELDGVLKSWASESSTAVRNCSVWRAACARNSR